MSTQRDGRFPKNMPTFVSSNRKTATALSSLGTLVRSRRSWLVALVATVLIGCERHSEPSPSPGHRVRGQRQPAMTRRLSTEEADPEASSLAGSEAPSRDSKLPVYALAMEPKNVTALERNPFSNEAYPGTFSAQGGDYKVTVRVRGAWSRGWPKKSLKISFKDQPFQGHRSLDFNSAWHDPAFVREPLAYYVYALCGAPASQSRLVRLDLNGRFRGLYVEIEPPGKSFLKRLNFKGAAVFKAASQANQADERSLPNEAAYGSHYTAENQKAEGFAELHQFCTGLQRASKPAEFLRANLEIDKYINYLAATVLVQNWDAFNKNHFLVYDGQNTKKWSVVPWDLDRTFGDHWSFSFEKAELPILLGTRQAPGITGWNRLEDRFLSDPDLRERFLQRLQELLDQEFTREKLFPVLDRYESEMAAEAELDRKLWPSRGESFHDGIAQIKSFIERRRAYLLAELPKLRRNGSTP